MFFQHLANGLLASSITALIGVGFLLVYKTSKFFHFAYGIILAFGAYSVFALAQISLAFPPLLIVLAIIISFFFGLLIEKTVYRPLRRRGGSNTALLIAALGLYSLVQNIISLIFGDEILSFRWWPIESGLLLFDARFTKVQIIIIICSWAILFLTWLFVKYTILGKRMDAVASDPELACVVGIDVERVHLLAMGMGSALGAIAGVLISCDVDMMPTMGMQPLMLGVVAVIIGGNTIWGTACGALLLGMAQHIGVIWIPTEWQDAIAFVVLLVFLIFRPQGFFGQQKRGSVV